MHAISPGPDHDGAGLPITVRVSLTGRKGPALLWFLTTPEGDKALVPWYIPTDWLNRIRLEIDAAGAPHFHWTGWNNGKGHAKFSRNGKATYCYRDIVERVSGKPLLRFDYVDHTCQRKSCLNLDHFEVVTPAINTARGPGAKFQFRRMEAARAG